VRVERVPACRWNDMGKGRQGQVYIIRKSHVICIQWQAAETHNEWVRRRGLRPAEHLNSILSPLFKSSVQSALLEKRSKPKTNLRRVSCVRV